MKGRAIVDAGICGFSADVTAESVDMIRPVNVTLKTDCPNLEKLGECFKVDQMDVIKNGCDSKIFKKLKDIIPAMHCPCPIMLAIHQAVKVAAGLALPKNIKIDISKEEDL